MARPSLLLLLPQNWSHGKVRGRRSSCKADVPKLYGANGAKMPQYVAIKIQLRGIWVNFGPTNQMLCLQPKGAEMGPVEPSASVVELSFATSFDLASKPMAKFTSRETGWRCKDRKAGATPSSRSQNPDGALSALHLRPWLERGMVVAWFPDPGGRLRDRHLPIRS
jgi:hypothetical protein